MLIGAKVGNSPEKSKFSERKLQFERDSDVKNVHFIRQEHVVELFLGL